MVQVVLISNRKLNRVYNIYMYIIYMPQMHIYSCKITQNKNEFPTEILIQ